MGDTCNTGLTNISLLHGKVGQTSFQFILHLEKLVNYDKVYMYGFIIILDLLFPGHFVRLN